MKHAWPKNPSRSPSSAKARSLSAWTSQRSASALGRFIQDDPFLERLPDQRVVLSRHPSELLGRVDEQVEPRPDIVEAGKVLEAFEERPGRIRHYQQIEVAPGISLSAGHRAKGDDGSCSLDVGGDTPPEVVEIGEQEPRHDGPESSTPTYGAHYLTRPGRADDADPPDPHGRGDPGAPVM